MRLFIVSGNNMPTIFIKAKSESQAVDKFGEGFDRPMTFILDNAVKFTEVTPDKAGFDTLMSALPDEFIAFEETSF